jgi:hypothetical protein
MDYKELFSKYQKLLVENQILKAENNALKISLGLDGEKGPDQNRGNATIIPLELAHQKLPSEIQLPSLKNFTTSEDKISLFMSLFKGRSDVYAKRWQSRDGRSGYSPVCTNEWQSGLCRKPEVKCFDWPHSTLRP